MGGAPVLLTQAGRGADPLRSNLGLHVGDDPNVVHRRRRLLSEQLETAIVWMDQTHSHTVATVSLTREGPVVVDACGRRPLEELHEGELGPVDADAVIVDARLWKGAPGAAVMTADCVPILLTGCDGALIAAVHAGRKGLQEGIISRTVSQMSELGATRIQALIGPSICGKCYEVPAQMRDEVAQTHHGAPATTSWGTPALDLVTAAADELRELGCRVDIDGRCTREDPTLHSYRRDCACGRQASVIAPA